MFIIKPCVTGQSLQVHSKLWIWLLKRHFGSPKHFGTVTIPGSLNCNTVKNLTVTNVLNLNK